MSLFLHIPASLNPTARVAAFNAAFGHPLRQVDHRGRPVSGIETKQYEDVPAANGDGRVILVTCLYHLTDAAEDAVDGCLLYSYRGAVAAGIIEHPLDEKGEPIAIEPDLRTVTEALPHQTRVDIAREFASEQAADGFLGAVGKNRGAVEARKAPDGRIAMRGVAEEMPIASLDGGAKILKREDIKDWPAWDGAKPPSGGFGRGA